MMKNIFFAFAMITAMAACSNNKANTNSGDSGPSTTNVQNVNGNQPDTSTGITLDNRQSTDSTHRDSVPH